MRNLTGIILMVLLLVVSTGAVQASLVTGDPLADGWAYGGNSLENGVYVRGSANYSFDLYSAALTVGAGSMLEIGDGAYSWQSGDLVLGLGGRFTSITAAEAGWDAFTGNAVNSQLSEVYGPGLQAKFGTSVATFSASTIAPGSGNGIGSTSAGGAGTVFVRTSRWFHATNPLLSQDTDTTWSGNSGELMLLDKNSHIDRIGTSRPDDRVARVIWIFDEDLNKPISWQILLNVSLLDRLQPDFNGLTPGIGDFAIISVQDRDSAYTDALVTVVPEPISMAMAGAGIAGVIIGRRKLRKKE